MQQASTLSNELRERLLEVIPHLRAFAISLTGNLDHADDLVQDTIVRGMSQLHQFEPGTNLQAWLFTILRNHFHSSFRRKRREVEDPDGLIAASLSTAPEQHGHLDLGDLRRALAKLPVEQREVLLLVAAEGLTYEEVAEICRTKVGTVKSRINRARTRLVELLHFDEDEDLGRDRVIAAPLGVGRPAGRTGAAAA